MAGQFRFKNNSGTVVAQISASNAGAISFSGSAVDFSSVATLTLGTSTLTGTASFATTAVSSSYASNALTGSNAMTASSADTLYVRNNITTLGSITAQTLVVQTVTSSVLFSTGSNKLGSSLSNTQELTGSVGITGSLAVVTTGTEFQVNAGGVNIGNALTDNHIISGSVTINPNGLFVSSSGNVGIGNTSPSAVLDVIGTDIFLGATSKIVLSYNYGTSANSNSPELAFYGQSFAATTSVYGPSIQAVNQTTFARKDLIFYQHNAADFANRYEAMRLTYGGSLLIGTTTDKAVLTVDGGGASSSKPTIMTRQGTIGSDYTNIAGAGDQYHGIVLRGVPSVALDYSVTPGDQMSFYEYGGDFRFYKKQPGILTNQVRFIDGVIYALNTTVQSISDIRTKENIANSEQGLDVITALRPVRFDFKDKFNEGRKNQLGFIAQEVEEVFSDAVGEWKDDNDGITYKTMGPGALIPILVKAIQELKAEIDILKQT